MIARVEMLSLGETQEKVFADLNALEPQPGPVNFWAVDERDEREPSHLGFTIKDTADFFKNPAYYYSARAHRESVDCGGFSMGLWKAFDGTEELQVAFCKRVAGYIRVCGAFGLVPRDELF